VTRSKKALCWPKLKCPNYSPIAAKYKAEIEVADLDYKRLSEAQKKAPDLIVPLAVDTAKSKSEVAKANLERAETLLQFNKNHRAPFPAL